MGQLSDTQLEKLTHSCQGWNEILERNARLLNDTLLKVSGLLDVNLTSLTNGDVLAWNTSQSKWINKPKGAVVLTTTSTTTTTTTSTTTTSTTTTSTTTTSTTSTTTTIPPGSWLGTWAKRVKIILDKDQVDALLSNFPVMIYLSASSGQSNQDLSSIFDELTSDDNRKKIAVTIANGQTQCYVEIERWDDTNEKAWLHVKVPSISSSIDTELYIYYDSSEDDNTTYVGDVGSTPGQTVWDSNFKAVYHLGEDPTFSGGADTTYLDEDMVAIDDWVNADNINGTTTQVTFDSKSCMKLAANAHDNGNWAHVNRDVGSFGNRVVVEMSLYCDDVGTYANSDQATLDVRAATVHLQVSFGSDGLLISDGVTFNEVGTNIVVQDTWQKWTFDIDFTTPASATVDVYLDGVLQASDVDCSVTGTFTDGHVHLLQRGATTDNQLSYVDYIKVGDKFIEKIIDSTSNENKGTPAGTMLAGDLVDGKVGKGLDFDGVDDNIGCGSDASIDDINAITIESVFKVGGWGEGNTGRVLSKCGPLNTNGWQILFNTGGAIGFMQGWTGNGIWYSPTSVISLDTWYHVVVLYNRGYPASTKPTMYLDSVSKVVTASPAPTGTIQSDAAENLCIGAREEVDREYDGIVDEVRLSNLHRSVSWIKATYHGLWDNLLTFSSEEAKPTTTTTTSTTTTTTTTV